MSEHDALSSRKYKEDWEDALTLLNDTEKKLNRMKALYVELTNCEQYGEDGEIQGHYCPNDLLLKFDDVFNA